MFHKTIAKAASAAALTLLIALPAAASSFTERFTSYYAFGDSLTDDGKFGLLPPPSLGGRFTDGLTYAEIVEDQFIAAGRDTGNLALGGATAGPVNSRPLGPLGTFIGQIATFQNALVNSLPLPTNAIFTEFQSGPVAPGERPLISVLFGANDFFQGQSVEDAADHVADGIRALASIGGGLFNDFVVATLPDIGATPAFSGAAATAATAASDAFNAQLLNNIDLLIGEGLNIYTFGSRNALQPLIDDIENNNGAVYGVIDGETPCTASLSELGPFCPNPTQLLFSDGVHPNSVAHQVIGDALSARLSAIPLPAGAPLVLLGLAGLGLAGRRRKAA